MNDQSPISTDDSELPSYLFDYDAYLDSRPDSENTISPGTLRFVLEGDAQEVLALLRDLVPEQNDSSTRHRRRRVRPKLQPEAVRDIRRRVAAGQPRKFVAMIFGIHYDTVSNIAKRKTWANIPD